jgi:protein-S-isoprenylcysteine O-methyltransferase Ste14
MDAINILVAVNFVYSMFMNLSGAKKGFKKKISGVVERPKTYLQKIPPNISAIIILATGLSIFNIGTLSFENMNELIYYRTAGLIIYVVFSFLQVKSFKSLGDSYSQDIAFLKGQKLYTKGLYRFIRHPQYVSQILSDLGAGIALLSYTVIPLVLFLEFPLFMLRAMREDKLLEKHFGDEFVKYKKRSGFFFPFIG